MNPSRIIPVLFFVAVTSVLMCTSVNYVGAGGETTNGCVAGSLFLEDGTPAWNTEVTIIPVDYDPVKNLPLPDSLKVMTDASGKYVLHVSENGIYNIEARRSDPQTRAIIHGIIVKERDTTHVPSAVLNVAGAIRILPADGSDTVNGYIYIPGTTAFVRINKRDYAVLDTVPAGIVPSIYYSTANSSSTPQLIINNVVVASGRTTIVSYYGWKSSTKVLLNTTASGAGVGRNVTGFPVLVRLTSANFDFSSARKNGEDIRFTKSDGTQMSFEIERWDSAAGAAEIWVKVDTVYGNDSTHFFTMYWGNASAVSASSGPAVFDVANGFQGVWHLDNDPAGGTGAIIDQTANQNNGTFSGGLTGSSNFAEGVIGTCLDFNGIDNYVQVARPVQNDFTISFWMKTNGSSITDSVQWYNGQGLVDAEVQYVHDDFGVSFLKNRIGFGTGNVDPDSLRDTTIISTDTVNDNLWHFITVTRMQSTGTLKLFVDGIENATGKGGTNMLNSAAFMRFGMLQTALYPFTGYLDEIQIASSVRTADWVKLSYMNQKENNVLVAYR